METGQRLALPLFPEAVDSLREHDGQPTQLMITLWSKMRAMLVADGTAMLMQMGPATKSFDPLLFPRPQQIGSLIRPRQSWFPSTATMVAIYTAQRVAMQIRHSPKAQ